MAASVQQMAAPQAAAGDIHRHLAVCGCPAPFRDYACHASAEETEFFQRLQTHFQRLDAAGINYRKPTEIDVPKD